MPTYARDSTLPSAAQASKGAEHRLEHSGVQPLSPSAPLGISTMGGVFTVEGKSHGDTEPPVAWDGVAQQLTPQTASAATPVPGGSSLTYHPGCRSVHL